MRKILKRMWAPLGLAIMLAQPILAQTWTRKTPAAAPPARIETALASLDQQQKTVLFGGKPGPYGKLNDTWLWDGVTWTQFTGTPAPPTLYGHAMAADGPSSVVVFGGWGPTGEEPLNQTWRFDGSKWEQILGPAPNWRSNHAMAYDRNADQIVMFGGFDGGGGDTWVFKNSKWTQVSPPTAPLVAGGHALAYDAERRQVVLFGGMGFDIYSNRLLLNETWVWDSGLTTWTKKTPAHSPPARFGHALVYDSAAHQVVLFGGTNDTERRTGLNDTWIWNGTDWTQKNLATAPPAKAFFAFAERSWAGDAVLFGGYDPTTDPAGTNPSNDTWVWQGPQLTALVQQPINPDGSSLFNANRGVVPVKFSLVRGGVQTCTLPPATISVQRTSGATAIAIDESLYAQAADSGSNFRIDAPSCQYIYNLSAPSLGAGTYQVKILIDGGAVGSATFGLK